MSKFLTLHEVAGKFRVYPSRLRNLPNLHSICIEVGKEIPSDLFPIGTKYVIAEEMIDDLSYQITLGLFSSPSAVNNANIIPDHYVARVMDMDLDMLREDVQQGFLKDYLLSSCSNGQTNLFFFKKKVLEKSRYKTLGQIARGNDLSESTLSAWKKRGYIIPWFSDIPYLYDEQEVINVHKERNPDLSHLMTWKEAEKKYGKLLYDIRGIAKMIFLARDNLSVYMNEENSVVADVFLKVGVDIQRHQTIHSATFALPENRIEELIIRVAKRLFNDPIRLNATKVVSDAYLSLRFLMDLKNFRNKVENEGLLKDQLVGSIPNGKGEKIYFFDKKLAMEKVPYKTLSEIGNMKFKNRHVNSGTLYRWAGMGKLPQPEFLRGTNLYIPEEVVQVANELLEAAVEERTVRKNNTDLNRINKFVFLPLPLQSLIDEYINYRMRGFPINFEGQKYTNKFISEQVKETHKRELSLFFYKVIVNARNDMDYKELDIGSVEDVDFESFEINSLNDEDIELVSETHESKAAFQRIMETNVKPFLFWYLMSLEKKIPYNDNEKWIEFREIRRSIVNAMNHIPNVPVSKYGNSSRKNFLTRLQIIQMIRLIPKIIIDPEDCCTALTILTMGFFMGIRTAELSKLEINDFKLNVDGYLWRDSDGFGRLIIPVDKSKKMNSPSPIFEEENEAGNLIVPRLADQIDLYLKNVIYKYQQERGIGYLFRKKETIHLPHLRHKTAQFIIRMIRNIRDQFDFLPVEKRRSFTFYDGRHTVGQLIDGTYIANDVEINDIKTEIAQCHLRHKGDKSFVVLKRHYRANTFFESYKKGIQYTLDFPWDEDGLKTWEEELLQKQATVEEVERIMQAEDKETIQRNYELPQYRNGSYQRASTSKNFRASGGREWLLQLTEATGGRKGRTNNDTR